MESLVDNDILFKAACYNTIDALLIQVVTSTPEIGVLGAARYVARKAVERASLCGTPKEALERLDQFINNASVIEPTDDEQGLAADLELAAQLAGVGLDVGESQLCAVLIVRSLNLLCTGDKRAIQAMEHLLAVEEKLRPLSGKIVCLEQLAIKAVSKDLPTLRTAICSEPGIDKTLTICFSCSSEEITVKDITFGLTSYINDLRRKAPNILAP
ncbi:MAG: hypothetical protein JNL64_00150 [Blastocatellia bacterium]|nr:hypothetical protein [Blastocatellia bacterium]